MSKQINELKTSLKTANDTINAMKEKQTNTEQLLIEINAKLSHLFSGMETPGVSKMKTKRDRGEIEHTPSSEMKTPADTKKQASNVAMANAKSTMDVEQEPAVTGDKT